MREHWVTLYPHHISVKVAEGKSLLEVVREADIFIESECGGKGLCRKCMVEVEEEGKWKKTLACQYSIKSAATIRIPPQVLLKPHVSLQREDKKIEGEAPLCKQIEVAPYMQKGLSYTESLQKALRSKGVDARIKSCMIPKLPKLLSRERFLCTIYGREVYNIGAQSPYSVSVDLGTTSVYASLIDIEGGRLLYTASIYNEQIRCGEDIITRINYAQREGGLQELQRLATSSINTLITMLLDIASASAESVRYIVVAANTCMIHLLLGIDPDSLRRSPYIPVAKEFEPIDAKKVGISVADGTPLFIIPCVSSFVGGDVVAGVLASQMHKAEELSLYIDLGTNGEIVLGNKEFLLCCSCSAGPAFEGGGIKCGVRAKEGAIEGVEVTKEGIKYQTINDEKAVGICGAGLIEVVAELLSAGMLEQNGRFAKESYILIAPSFDTATGKDIILTEQDIENIMRAKAAVYAGICFLLKRAQLDIERIRRVFVAGNLGTHLDVKKAVIIGLFPELEEERFHFLGNASLAGASLCTLSHSAFCTTKKIASSMTNFELSEEKDFMDEYVAALFLPHTQEDKFPKVYASLRR